MAWGGWQEKQEGRVTADEARGAARCPMLRTWKSKAKCNPICIFTGWLGRELVVGGKGGDRTVHVEFASAQALLPWGAVHSVVSLPGILFLQACSPGPESQSPLPEN